MLNQNVKFFFVSITECKMTPAPFGITEEIQALINEQDLLQERKEEIDKRLRKSQAATAPLKQQKSEVGGRADSVVKWEANFEWDENVLRIRKEIFGISSFRKHQREVLIHHSKEIVSCIQHSLS